MVSNEQLLKDLERIGIKKGDVIYLKASMREVGQVEKGVKGVLDALFNAVGAEGTIVVSAYIKGNIFPFSKKKISSYYNKDIPTYNGIISSEFLNCENVLVSGHPMYRYGLWGKYAKELSTLSDINSSPYEILKIISEKYNAKALVVGKRTVGYGTTHITLKEALRNKGEFQKKLPSYLYYYTDNRKVSKYKSNQNSFCTNSFKSLFTQIEGDIVISRAVIGNAPSLLIDMRKSLSVEYRFLSRDLSSILCNDPLCYKCRISFTFSDRKYLRYIFYSIDGIFIRFLKVLYYFLLGRNTQ